MQTFKCPSLDSCQKRFLWTPEEVDLAKHPIVGLVLQVGDSEDFPRELGFENVDLYCFLVFFIANRIYVSQPS